MAKPQTTWTVHPHGPIEKLEDNLWRVEAALPGAPIPRTMVLVRLADGRLVIHNAIALGDADMATLEGFGKPAFLIVPNARHRLDAPMFKARYPELTVVAPPGARDAIAKVVAVDSVEPSFGDPAVRYEVLDGTAGREGALLVKSAGGVTLVLNDIISNVRRGKGFKAGVLALLGFSGPVPQISRIPRMVLVKDKRNLAAHLERLAATAGLSRVIVAHGLVIGEAPAQAVRAAVAAAL